MKRVLLPTDFSENSFKAICYVIELFKEETCVFFLMNAYTPPIYRVDYVLGSPGQLGLPDDYQHFANTNLKWFEAEFKKKFNNPKHSFVLQSVFDTLSDAIKNQVKNENIDLIVMGTQGATGARELILGSNTLHTIKKAEVPVLAIPLDFRFKPPKELLFPTDLEIDFKRKTLDTVLEISKQWQSKIHILHVTSPDGLDENQQNNKQHLEKMLKKTDFTYHDLPDQDLLVAINGFSAKSAIDMLIMIQNKHTFLERLFIEPIVRNLGLHSKIPLLVLPQPETQTAEYSIDLYHGI